MEATPSVRIQVCGRVVVDVGGTRRESALPSRQGKLLFVYMLVHRQRAISRAQLVDAVWPSRPPGEPDAALSALLSKLRKALGSELVHGREEPRLTLPADAFVDIEAAAEGLHRAESAVAQEQWARAWGPARVALHTANRGFLPGHEAPWIEDVRASLEDTRLRALECVAAAGLGLGGPELAGAERAGRRLIELAPYSESGYRALMEVLARRDEVPEALRVHDRLRVLLRDELGIAPSARIQELHERLLTRA